MTDEKKLTNGDEPAKNVTPPVQSTKPVAPAAVPVKDPDEKGAVKDEGTSDVSVEEQKKLEAMLGEEPEVNLSREERGRKAHDKLQRIFSLVAKDTPGEHVLFGLAGQVFTVDDLRALFGR